VDQPPQIPSWYIVEFVTFTVVNENILNVDHRGIHKAAATHYAFGLPGSALQLDVLDSVPGVLSYYPWWHVIQVVTTDGRDPANL
jgi:hypothetical protein